MSSFNKEQFIQEKLRDYTGYSKHLKRLDEGDLKNNQRAQDLIYQLLFDVISNLNRRKKRL